MSSKLDKTDDTVVGKQFFHDICTPLLRVEINVKSLERYLPILLETYITALNRGDDVPLIPARVQKGLQESVGSLHCNVEKIRAMIDEFMVQCVDQQKASSAAHRSAQHTAYFGTSTFVQHQQGDEISILLADDEPINQQVIGDMLDLLGCQVDLVNDGQSAVEQWRANTYDLILMDCQLPMLDGYQATETIRQSETTRTPIIALTAYFAEDEKHRCQQAGMDAIASKPVKLDELKALLAQFIPLSDAMKV